ncbi:MAG: DUF262 domain-containing protein [Aeromonas veronii]
MLQTEIENAARLVRTDAYQMSIGEIVNMYKDGEIIINPDFQRLFRWDIGQKSKLIESLLLGIPIPSIFVFERDDSTWELIDGLQRLSTLLEFMGELKDTNGMPVSPTALVATKYLPSLDKAVWALSDNISEIPIENQTQLDTIQKLTIKRGRLSVEILKRPSDNSTKYDLFQRLNSGGTVANPQELRNCIIIMVNPEYSTFLKSLSEDENFRKVIAPSEDQIEKQKHMEYISRFMVYNYISYDGKLDVEEYIDDGIVKLAKDGENIKARETFLDTFRILHNAFGNNALRRISENDEHSGRIGLAAFECIAIGVAKNIDFIRNKTNPESYVRERVKEFWSNPDCGQFFSLGLRGTVRIQRTLSFGAEWFSK